MNEPTNTDFVSLTEASASTRVHILLAGGEASESNVRVVPYVDLYSQRNAVMETPESRLARAAEPATDEVQSAP